jgi:hypothetical protein
MFDSVTNILRTIIIGVLVLLAGWWTLFLRSQIGAHETAIANRDERIGALTEEMSQKEGEIRTLGEELAAQDVQIQALTEEVAFMERQVQLLEASLRLLKVDHRLARVEVLEQMPSPDDPDRMRTLVRFTEVDAGGMPLGPPLDAGIEGRRLYIETQVIKFGDEYVEGGDSLRGSSICLFRRLFGEDQSPASGVSIDSVGTRPMVYGGDNLPDSQGSLLYRELWSRFWDYANDPDLARESGIRAIHGEAPFIELRPGRTYRVELRSSGGITILAED